MIYLSKGRAKVEIALARGKHNYDKRDTIAKRDADRQIRRALKNEY
jgi:SsrA-binding protein